MDQEQVLGPEIQSSVDLAFESRLSDDSSPWEDVPSECTEGDLSFVDSLAFEEQDVCRERMGEIEPSKEVAVSDAADSICESKGVDEGHSGVFISSDAWEQVTILSAQMWDLAGNKVCSVAGSHTSNCLTIGFITLCCFVSTYR